LQGLNSGIGSQGVRNVAQTLYLVLSSEVEATIVHLREILLKRIEFLNGANTIAQRSQLDLVLFHAVIQLQSCTSDSISDEVGDVIP
jgi:hypothetical protein